MINQYTIWFDLQKRSTHEEYDLEQSPQPQGHRPVPVHGLLELGITARGEWWASEQASSVFTAALAAEKTSSRAPADS